MIIRTVKISNEQLLFLSELIELAQKNPEYKTKNDEFGFDECSLMLGCIDVITKEPDNDLTYSFVL